MLALFTFIWFFVVPIPGLLVFTAFDYRISITFTGLTLTVALLVGFLLVGRASAALPHVRLDDPDLRQWVGEVFIQQVLPYMVSQALDDDNELPVAGTA